MSDADNEPVPRGAITYTIVESGSERGKAKLVSSDGYCFTFKRQLKNGTVEWRCSVRGKNNPCSVVVRQTGDTFNSTGVSAHTHPARPGILTAVQVKAHCKNKGKVEVFESANNIVSSINNQLSDPSQPEGARSNHNTLIRIINRARASCRPKDPSDLTFDLDLDYLEETIPEEFFRRTVIVGGKKHFIFCTTKQANYLVKGKTWYLDGTFKVVKQPFYQLLSIHCFVKNEDCMKQIPLCFVIMSGKRSKDYTAVLKAVTEILPATPSVSSFVVDFEAGLWKGIRSIFNDPMIKGCAYHFTQALWRKVQELGLQTLYCRRDNVYKIVKKVLALPFLPHEDIEEAFCELSGKVGVIGPVREFMDYVRETWLTHRIWKVENWSVFGRSIRTNNDVEGWHHKLNKSAKKGNLPFYLLINLLYLEAKEIPNQVKLVKEGKLKRRQRKQVKEIQGRIMGVWNDYNERKITTSQLLKKCAYIYV